MRATVSGLTCSALLLMTGESALALEEPAYEVLLSTEAFEIRRYAPYVVAETTVQGSFKGARNNAFRRLFAFISGKNTRGEELPERGPTMRSGRDANSEKIAMTVPVFSKANGDVADRWTMAFVMPPGRALETLPAPTDPLVTLREVAPDTVAVRRYSGNTGEPRFIEQAGALLEALEEAGVEVLGEPVQAVYNGPFTLGPFRRNEVVVVIAGPPSKPSTAATDDR
jgi:hypothetical protein